MPFSSAIRERLPVLKYNGEMIDNIFGKDLKDKQKVIKIYNAINEETLNFLPKERSLVYEVKSGWEPLCNFLNVPIPSEPFPRSNTREQFKKNVASISAGKPVQM
jgi:hypothetical protein